MQLTYHGKVLSMPGLSPTKIALTMRLTIVLMIVATLKVSAGAFAQTVSVSVKNAPMEDVFSSVKKQTGYLFFYDRDLLHTLKPVTIKAENTALTDFLTQVFNGQPATYIIKDKTIFIMKKALPPAGNNPLLNMEATQQPVTGVVKDAAGNPLPGVTVKVKGTNTGTITDANGRFSIAAGPGDDLVVTYVGFEAQTFHIGNFGPFQLYLKEKPSSLDETVVIGYGTTSKRNNTGSVSSIKSGDIASQPVLDAIGAMQGRVSGVFINSSSGLPGSNFKVTVRGQSSILNPSDPLYVIDGVPFYSDPINQFTSANGSQSPLATINPADIERIDVLKDADATSIYGSRGGNGVILITTKKGKAGKTQTNFNVYTGIGKVVNTVKMLNTPEYIAMRKEAYAHDNVAYNPDNAPDLTVWDQQQTMDWQKYLMGSNAHITEAQGSVSGGNEQTQFLFSGTYHKETTVMPGSLGFQRGAGHLNVNHSSTDGKFNITASASYSASVDNSLATDLATFYNLPPNYPLYDSTGKYYWFSMAQNPAAYLIRKSEVRTNNLVTNSTMRYTLLPGLNLKANLGYTRTDMKQMRITPNASFNPMDATGSQSYFGNSSFGSYIVEPQVDYNRRISKGDLQLLAGASWQQSITQGQSVIADGFSSDALLEDQQAASVITPRPSQYAFYRYTSVFGRVNYNWEGKYIVNASFRRDGSTRFGPGNRFGNFGAVGAAWIFSKEEFMKELSFLSFGKLRASIGNSGNDKVGDYRYLDSWASTNFPYNGVPGLSPSRLPNSLYRWEENRKKEVGLELGFLNDRILFNTNYYYNISDNQLVDFQLSPQVGFPSITANLPASVENKGWEFELNTVNVRQAHFKWNSSLNLTISRNKLKSFPDIEASAYKDIYVVGQPLSIVKGYQFLGVDPQTGRPTFFSNSGSPTPAEFDDYVILGNSDPRFYGGLQNSFTWKEISLDFLFQFVKQEGPNINYGYNSPAIGTMANQDISALDRWKNKGDNTSVPGASTASGAADFRNYSLSTANWGDASYIRLKNISLRYDLSKYTKKWKVNNLSVYGLAQNLITITNYSGLDPETQGKIMPPLKSYVVGLTLGL
ncbi:TonB-linked outer membrane protein, SusC/RagA family [Chitinophaga arvensicola]|uniref:TonB-linked outer membrane protein, SusC/RagA family n=2 Tax=Chitinophaga arvensicola TaxID=29529 RepID=A0A1I0RDI4_9BACT|nr:TonB-linked outer membrane protein, SusC/RagA family [Chitinophaga arvensicola]